MTDGPWFRCDEDGCPIRGVTQHLIPPMTGREAFERHNRTNHPDPGPGRRP